MPAVPPRRQPLSTMAGDDLVTGAPADAGRCRTPAIQRNDCVLMAIAFGNATDLGNNGLSFIAADPPIIGAARHTHRAPYIGDRQERFIRRRRGAFPPVDDITSVTDGGSLVEVAKYVPRVEDNQRCLYLYGLIDPPAGTHNVITECDGSQITSRCRQWIIRLLPPRIFL